ncbi:MAG TPA: hypothetical protein VES69_07470 [Pyrinomonadaceae bacterium]|nr:hypothetical protein [Pyrinomonadaceae bacterium]
MPKVRRAAIRSLSPVVRARIQLEASLRVCGVDPAPKVTKFTAVHRRVLLAMLSKVDSPVSASLRARAADVTGTLRIREAAPVLRRMALDEQEDLQTRLNSVCSYALHQWTDL